MLEATHQKSAFVPPLTTDLTTIKKTKQKKNKEDMLEDLIWTHKRRYFIDS